MEIEYKRDVTKEILSIADRIRSVMDDLKLDKSKILFTCVKLNLHKEIKVAELADAVSEQTGYHKYEKTISLAHNFSSTNNLDLLVSTGHFGTHAHGGKDDVATQYLFTMLNLLACHVMNPQDSCTLLMHLYDDDDRKIQPEWFCPTIR